MHYSTKDSCFANLITLNVSNIKVTNQGDIDMANILSNATKLKDLNLNNFIPKQSIRKTQP